MPHVWLRPPLTDENIVTRAQSLSAQQPRRQSEPWVGGCGCAGVNWEKCTEIETVLLYLTWAWASSRCCRRVARLPAWLVTRRLTVESECGPLSDRHSHADRMYGYLPMTTNPYVCLPYDSADSCAPLISYRSLEHSPRKQLIVCSASSSFCFCTAASARWPFNLCSSALLFVTLFSLLRGV